MIIIGDNCCLICGFDRAIQQAHLDCGSNKYAMEARGKLRNYTIPLCPNHHWLYDHQGLLKDEIKKLPIEYQLYYKAPNELEAAKVMIAVTNNLSVHQPLLFDMIDKIASPQIGGSTRD